MIKALRQWLTGYYESEPITIGQPFGPNTNVTCGCGRWLSTRATDWVRVEETRRYETICPTCGPVQAGAW